MHLGGRSIFGPSHPTRLARRGAVCRAISKAVFVLILISTPLPPLTGTHKTTVGRQDNGRDCKVRTDGTPCVERITAGFVKGRMEDPMWGVHSGTDVTTRQNRSQVRQKDKDSSLAWQPDKRR